MTMDRVEVVLGETTFERGFGQQHPGETQGAAVHHHSLDRLNMIP